MKDNDFTLLGYDNPLGRYPAPVVPVGRLGDKLVALYAGVRTSSYVPLEEDAQYVEFEAKAHEKFANFNPWLHRLFAFDTSHLEYFPIEQEKLFFTKLLRQKSFSSNNPFLRLSLAEVTNNSKLIVRELTSCVVWMHDSTPELVDLWYKGQLDSLKAYLPYKTFKTIPENWRYLPSITKFIASPSSDNLGSDASQVTGSYIAPILYGIVIVILGACLYSTRPYLKELADWIFILACIVLTNILLLGAEFHRHARGYMWGAARRIWTFLVPFFLIEWLIGILLYHEISLVVGTSRLPLAIFISWIIVSVPVMLERLLLPKKVITVKRIQKPLTKMLLKILLRHKFSWAIGSSREQDVYDCQQPNAWGLKVTPVELGRRIRQLYEFYKYDIAAERNDPSLLHYDVDHTPWDMFYLLVRHVGRKRLRKYLMKPIGAHHLGWDGRERRRSVGTKLNRDRTVDPDPERSRGYDHKQMVERLKPKNQQDKDFLMQSRTSQPPFSTERTFLLDMTTSYDNHHASWFSDWFSRAWPNVHPLIFNKHWVQILPIINVVGMIGAIAGFVAALANPERREEYLFYVNDIGHIILLFIAFCFFLPRLGAKRSYHQRAEGDAVGKAVGEFKIWLNLLVFFWFLFYLARAFADGPKALKLGTYETLAAQADQAADYINTISALALFGLYTSAEYAGASRWSARERLSLPVVFIVLASTLQIIAHAATGTDHTDLDLLAGIVNGLIVGIATVLLIGRLDSRYIGLHKAVVIVLYCYALIQPLFPYIFEHAEGLRLITQYTFVATALVMKFVLILSLGKIIDNGTLHFYISSMQWIDKHADTLRIQHESALVSGISTEGGPYLLSMVPPDRDSAKICVEKQPDVRVQLGILNAWLGVSWDIKDLSVKEVQISGEKFKVKKVTMINEKSVRLSDKKRFTEIDLNIDLDVDSVGLKEQLKKDEEISHGISRNQETKQVKVILVGLEANTSLLNDERDSRYFWHKLESVDLTNCLFYKATLELEALK